MDDKHFMKLAIDEAFKGVEKGQRPFGACIAKGGKVIGVGHNTELADSDPTAHAEMNAIRDASKKISSTDLSGCVLYATCEPCSMCREASLRAKIPKIIFGIQGRDVRGRDQPSELKISTEIIGSFMKEENLKVIKLWKEKNKHD